MAKCKWVDKDGNIDINNVNAKEMTSAYLHNLTIDSNDEFRNNILEAVSKMLWAEAVEERDYNADLR